MTATDLKLVRICLPYEYFYLTSHLFAVLPVVLVRPRKIVIEIVLVSEFSFEVDSSALNHNVSTFTWILVFVKLFTRLFIDKAAQELIVLELRVHFQCKGRQFKIKINKIFCSKSLEQQKSVRF